MFHCTHLSSVPLLPNSVQVSETTLKPIYQTHEMNIHNICNNSSFIKNVFRLSGEKILLLDPEISYECSIQSPRHEACTCPPKLMMIPSYGFPKSHSKSQGPPEQALISYETWVSRQSLGSDQSLSR